jgi:CubicO group peptidase (beta-lactamase class C family)
VPDGVHLAPLLEAAFEDPELATSYAVVVVHGGRLVAERYGGALEHWDRPAEPVGPDTPLLSWSMAKSVLHAVIGILVGQGRVRPGDPAPVPYWEDGDPRRAITWEQLLQMRSGLRFFEEYYEDGGSDVIEMLFGAGADDVARFAAGFPLDHEPGSTYNYSSGTSNLLAVCAQSVIGGGEAGMRAFLRDELFAPLGMASAEPGFDAAGTFVASSYVHATARDFARFGLLYLRDGVWDGRRLLPEGWVDHGRRVISPDEDVFHGAHWWARDDHRGTFYADGFEGQRILCVPAVDVVLVRLGKTHADHAPALDAHLLDLVDQFVS